MYQGVLAPCACMCVCQFVCKVFAGSSPVPHGELQAWSTWHEPSRCGDWLLLNCVPAGQRVTGRYFCREFTAKDEHTEGGSRTRSLY